MVKIGLILDFHSPRYMAPVPALHRFLGLRTGEAPTVRLFFLHNFLLGIGTILVYVSANVILLENHPETSLPVAYLTSAAVMMGVAKLYTYFEHHLVLQKLAVRVLMAVCVLTFVMGILVLTGHSVASAVAIMAGYRVIYLLTNLEFWGISAVVFDVRQGKRLFSVISAGDMPAKALGAGLSVIVHNHTDLYWLLLTAFGAYLAALAVLRYTLASHAIDTSPAPVRLRRRAQPSIVKQLFGGNDLVFAMCLSLMAIAGVVTSVEYFFFVNVKHKFHDQADLMRVVGTILGMTYLLAMVFKLILSRQTFERFGVSRSLAVLPMSGLLALVLFGILYETGISEEGLLIYFCGLYLLLEVLRRAVFDPVFLVLFQPLSPPDRLQGHTLVKGFYEPLGMAVAGLLLLVVNNLPQAGPYVSFVWMAGFMGLALFWLRRTYGTYLLTLKDTLGRRFSATDELAMPTTAVPVMLEALRSPQPDDVLNAFAWLQEHQPTVLPEQADYLLGNPDKRIRLRVLTALQGKIDPARLRSLALNDPEASVRRWAAYWLARRTTDADRHVLLLHMDWAVQTGLIDGWLSAEPDNRSARQRLHELMASGEANYLRAALPLSRFLPDDERVTFIGAQLGHGDTGVQVAAIRAAGDVVHPELTNRLVALLTDSTLWHKAADSLVQLGSAAVPYLRDGLDASSSETLVRRVAGVCGRLTTRDGRDLLLELAQSPNRFRRAAAGRELKLLAPEPTDAPVFQTLLTDEWQLTQRLLQGQQTETDPVMLSAITYELGVVQQRIFTWLGQLYDTGAVADAQRGVVHAARDRKANALEMLDNLLPRTTYQALQELVDTGSGRPAHQAIDQLVGPSTETELLPDYLLRQGENVFSDWTISVALRHIDVGETNANRLLPLLDSVSLLVREGALDLLQSLPIGQWARYQTQLAALNKLNPVTMSHNTTTNHISAVERVQALKRTALFAGTPENVLASIVPIMKEVTFYDGQEIFAKGDPGDCMFIVYDGEVGIFDGDTQLATVTKGGFFGELALLDAETRSASTVAQSYVVAFRIDQADFYDLTEERGEVLQNIIRVLCQRLRKQNELIRG